MTKRAVAILSVLGIFLAGASRRSASRQAQRSLEQIRRTQTIMIGFPESAPPFAYLDKHQHPTGYTVDICRAAIDELRKSLRLATLTIRYIPTTSATRIPLLQNGTIDLECGTATNIAARHQLVSFAPTTFVSDIVLVARKDSGLDVNDPRSFPRPLDRHAGRRPHLSADFAAQCPGPTGYCRHAGEEVLRRPSTWWRSGARTA